MKGNEFELWIASFVTTCNFITVQSNRCRMLIVNKHCAIFTTPIKRTLGKVPKVSA